MNGKTWIAAFALVMVICSTFAGFMWKVDVKSAEADVRLLDKYDILDGRADKMESKYAEVNTSLKYIQRDMAEQRAVSKEILAELRNGG